MLLAIMLCFSALCFPALADNNDETVYETITGGDVDIIRAATPPKAFFDLSGASNTYEATLIDLAASRGSYTRYYFKTGTGNLYLKGTMEKSGSTSDRKRDMLIRLYEKSSKDASGSCIENKSLNYTFETDEAEKIIKCEFTGLDPNKYYYILFYNNSDTDEGSGKDISGTIVVDDEPIDE